jgi:hypothetical protein
MEIIDPDVGGKMKRYGTQAFVAVTVKPIIGAVTDEINNQQERQVA